MVHGLVFVVFLFLNSVVAEKGKCIQGTISDNLVKNVGTGYK